MPELPEVEVVKRGLAKFLPGKTIRDVWYDWDKSFPNAPADVENFLLGAKIVNVRRRAKVLIIELNTKYSLIVHLKMTGQLVYVSDQSRFGAGHPSDSLIGQLPDASTRVILDLGKGEAKLFFNDQRKFGWMRLVPTAEIPAIDFFKRLGPEPLAADFTYEAFAGRINKRPKSSIKAVLLDQTIIAGVGNIYADEALFAARIHPAAKVGAIPPAALRRLFVELIAVLKLSIEKGGSTDRNYVNAEGKKGSYTSFAKVFRRDGQPCPRCGTILVKTRVAGRGTHVCPICQPKPEEI